MNLTETTPPSAVEDKAPIIRSESCSLATARRVAAMLDLDPSSLADGAPLPRGWQFVLMAADTRRSALRADGFPGLGVAMPELGLPRLMLGGRKVAYLQDIPIGAAVQRTSAMQSLVRKETATGPMAVATIQHTLHVTGNAAPALVETQTYLLLPARKGAAPTTAAANLGAPTAERTATSTPDETLLFQYSALGFNSHRIHIDRFHARNIEGFPDLVVNGGLATLLLTEFMRNELGLVPTALNIRHVAPLYCGRQITMTADPDGVGWRLKAFDDRQVLAIDMEVTV